MRLELTGGETKKYIMKTKLIKQCGLALVLGLGLMLPLTTHAGGVTGQMIAKLEPIKSPAEMAALAEGDTVAKVCMACKQVTLVRVVKGGKGLYDVVAKKCENCGSEDTFLAYMKSEIPFKERVKR